MRELPPRSPGGIITNVSTLAETKKVTQAPEGYVSVRIPRALHVELKRAQLPYIESGENVPDLGHFLVEAWTVAKSAAQ